MYAFLSHESAREVLRNLGDGATQLQTWPSVPRPLPLHGDCVTTQRAYTALMREIEESYCAGLSSPVDLLVPEAAKRSRGRQATFHVWKHDVPAHAMLRLEPSLYVSSSEFVLLQMAGYRRRQQPVVDGFVRELRAAQEVQQMMNLSEPAPFDDPYEWDLREHILLMVLHIMEFAGTYRLKTAAYDTRYRCQPLMSRTSADSCAHQVRRLYGTGRVREALRLAFDGSASPMETALVLMLSLPREYGGYGLPRPLLNVGLPTGEWERVWDGGEFIHPDLVWPDGHVAIEYDSDEFHAGLGSHKVGSDAERANVLTSMGYTVLRATTMTLRTPRGVDRLAWQVAQALRCELAEADQVLAIRRNKLFAIVTR